MRSLCVRGVGLIAGQRSPGSQHCRAGMEQSAARGWEMGHGGERWQHCTVIPPWLVRAKGAAEMQLETFARWGWVGFEPFGLF